MPRRRTDNGIATLPPPSRRDSKSPPYEMLKTAILEGELAPGQALIETQLAESCGVSRTPIREALRRLEQDGLIHHQQGGLVVRERSPGNILDNYETRIALEATVARVAAERRTEHDVQLLRVLSERGKRVNADDPAALVEVNNLFHQAIWHASRNESLIDALERLRMHLGRYPETTLAAPGRWEVACLEHQQLVEAIDRRDGKAAQEIAAMHFTEARDIRLALFAQH